jgi:hypothetical protein
MTCRAIGLLAAGVVWMAGCGSPVAPLGNAQPAPHALASAVLDAVARRDVAALRSLSLNESEFRELVWPELPAARPERNLPFSYVWGDLHQKSEESLMRILAEHGGQRYALVSLRNDGETTRYPSYTVHRETVLQVRNQGGPQFEVRLFGSLIEQNGGWKVFSYVVDD